MPYQRGDIIELPFRIPQTNVTKNHPAIIISNQDVYNNEGIYICVMVTHSDLYEIFAFDLTSDMFIGGTNIPEGKAKAHLIAYVSEKDIIVNNSSKKNKMKKIYVDKLVDFIADRVLMEY